MPIVVLDRMPVPSLKTYTSVSVLLVACVCYFSHTTVLQLNDPNYKEHGSEYEGNEETNEESKVEPTLEEPAFNGKNESLTTEEYLMDFAAVVLQEPWCVWVRTCHYYYVFV